MNQHENDALLSRIASLGEDTPPLPEGFHERWVGRLEADMSETKAKRPWKTAMLRSLAVAATAVFILGGAWKAQKLPNGPQSRNSAAQTRGAVYDAVPESEWKDAAYDMPTEVSEDAGYGMNRMASVRSTAANEAGAAQQKIIRTASLTIGTQQYDESLAALLTLCENAGGWSSSTSEQTASNGLRTAYLTLRVPSESLDDFLSGTGGLGRVTHRSETADDVTETYQDAQARLETQQALMARLQALVTDAASLSELLELEAQIADTQYQIDRLQSSLNVTDRQVDYATVDVTLSEEKPSADLTDGEASLGQRLASAVLTGGSAFLSLLADAAVFLAAALPFAAVAAIVWAAALLIRTLVRKRR